MELVQLILCWYCIKFCFPMQPAILPIQIIRIGQLVILCVPGGIFPFPNFENICQKRVHVKKLWLSFGSEFTTMAGGRLRDAVKTVLTSDKSGEFNNNIHVVLAGLTNTHSQYVTTFEEYEIQRYEVHMFCSQPIFSLIDNIIN
jgi:neutral ceramidase